MGAGECVSVQHSLRGSNVAEQVRLGVRQTVRQVLWSWAKFH